MSNELQRGVIDRVSHAVFYGTSDLLAAQFPGYKKANDRFQRRSGVVKAVTSVILEGAVAVGCTVSAPTPKPPELYSTNPAFTQTVEVPPDFKMALPIQQSDVDFLLSHCTNCDELGINTNGFKGIDFGQDRLLYTDDAEGGDYFWIERHNGSIEQVDSMVTADSNILLLTMQLPNQPIKETRTYVTWNPNIKGPKGEDIITYQPDGTPDTAESYAIPNESSFPQLDLIFTSGELPVSSATPTIEAATTPTDPPPTETALPTRTSEPTRIPEASYNCSISPEALNTTKLSLKDDIQSVKLAEWVKKQPAFNRPISADHSKLVYKVEDLTGENTSYLSTTTSIDSALSAKNASLYGICRFNLDQIGIPGKNDGYLAILILEDVKGNHMPAFTFMGNQEFINLKATGALTDPMSSIRISNNMPSAFENNFIITGSQPGKEGDLRDVRRKPSGSNSPALLAAQNLSVDDARQIMQEIVTSNGVFTPAIIDKFSRTIFFGLDATFRQP